MNPQELQDIKYLLHGHLKGELTEAEQAQLRQWVSLSPANRNLYNRISDQEQLLPDMQLLYTSNENILSRLSERIPDMKSAVINETAVAEVHRVHVLKTAWFRYAAAILLIVTGVAVYYNLSRTSLPENKLVQDVAPENDLQPGFNRAILTLSNGQKIKLDSAASEAILDGTLSIENHNGQLNYYPGSQPIPSNGGVDAPGTNTNRNQSGLASGERVGYNTMTTPRGGQYKLTLADGTKVWLNAASSITYPVAFHDKTREVLITGEAYFEVANNHSVPFIVKTKDETIAVLGTAFNINAYEDEGAAKTSLLSGSIKVNNRILKPGQASINGKIIQTDVSKDISWKNGEFNFEDMNVEQAMRQISRWYDIEIVYQSKPPDIRFFGSISREVTLTTVLRALEKSKVKFKIENGKLIVQ